MGVAVSCVENAVRDVDTECGDWGPLAASVSSVQGWRRSMEDAHVAYWDADKKIGIFGVFDGHGGQAVALYVAKHLVPVLTDREAYRQGKYERALHETFMELDRLMMTQKGQKEVTMLDKEAQAACPDPIIRLPIDAVKSDLLALIGGDSSDEDSDDSDDDSEDNSPEVAPNEEPRDADMKGEEGAAATGDGPDGRRRSTRIAATKQRPKKDKKQLALDGILFLLEVLIPDLPKDL
ncbi:Protein phosphatase 2C, putative, partial [Perkinsus marinus ATCC 50983]